MSDTDPIRQRGQALEDEFFDCVDEALRAELRKSLQRDKAKEQLAAATGFQDQELLDHLVDTGFEPATVAALALAPAVFVAWADGSIAAGERQSIMHEALQRGLEEKHAAFELVEAWLHKRPPQTLWRLWQEYARAVQQSLTPTLSEMLMKEILRQCTAVAEASAGFLAIGKVSTEEQAMLDKIAEVCA
jgi:hypothetical protein